MKVEIWSDVMCPFCYIGKRRFEHALRQFPHAEDVTVEWKSFQLNPDVESEHGRSLDEYLAERKGCSLEEAKKLNDQVAQMAAQAGLHYDFDKAIVANSFDAHRFSHLAASHGLGGAAEEALFKAYFTEGRDISDHATLVQLGLEIGLEEGVVRAAIDSDAFAEDVHKNILEAQILGVRGVPFFVMNRKYVVSGAQPEDTFKNAIGQAYEDWDQERQKV